MTFFRIQEAHRNVEDLVSAERDQISYSWGGPESYDQPGVSACRTREDLITYLAQSAIPYGVGEWVIVEMEADMIYGSKPMDASIGEVLVWPTEIVSVQPMDDEFFELIGTEFDRIHGA